MPGSLGTGPRPQAIGVRKSLGFGDRLGLAAAGQLAVAAEHPDFAPFFVQSSPRAMAEAGRTPQETLAAAARAIGNARYRQPWGADADGLRTPQEVDETAAAGFTYFTIDLSAHVRDDAVELPPAALATAVETMVADGDLPEDWAAPYLGRTVELPGSEGLQLDIDALRRAAVRFGHAILHGARMYETVARANRGRPYEIEISLDQIGSPISAAEHLFLGLELEARGVRMTALALRLANAEPVVFEASLREHLAVASFCGPYKLSFRSDAHDPVLVPVIGRTCGDLLHYKTSAESYLEALRLGWRLEPDLFHQMIVAAGAAPAPDGTDPEEFFVNGHAGGRRMDQLSGEVLAHGHLKAALLELVDQRADVYQELLVARYKRLIQTLNAG